MHRDSHTGPRAARWGEVDVKLIVALVFAIAGLSWAAVSLLDGRGEPESDEPRVIASALDAEGNAVEPEYTSTSGRNRLDSAAEQIENIVSAEAMGTLSSISVPAGTPEGVSEAVVNAFLPILKGDHNDFLAAIEAMGGMLNDDLDGEHRMFTHLAKEFEGAKVDLSRISVKKYEPRDRGDNRMEMTRDEDESGDGPRMQSMQMEMRPESLFPDAPELSDPSAIEVSIPVQPKGEELETVFGLVLTWNSEVRLWQPATYSVTKNRLVEGDG